MLISCIIIDDEPHALRLLEEYIGKIPSLRLMGKFFDAMESIEFLKKEPVDLIFTDINLPGLSGLELAENVSPQQKIIFITAFAEYALSSFRYNVIDYLLKPISLSRFIHAVNKVELLMNGKTPSTASGDAFEHVFVKSGRQVVRIDFREVLYIEGEREYIGFCTGHERVLVYKRLKDIEALLPNYFMRVHLSYIVNTHHIQKIESHQVYIADTQLPIGDNYKETFMRYVSEKII